MDLSRLFKWKCNNKIIIIVIIIIIKSTEYVKDTAMPTSTQKNAKWMGIIGIFEVYNQGSLPILAALCSTDQTTCIKVYFRVLE